MNRLNHVAFIMDGNGRWGKRKNKSRNYGHLKGVETVKKIVTTCPHCFNTIKNEYPELGGLYDVMHHTQLLQSLIDEGRLTVEGGDYKGK